MENNYSKFIYPVSADPLHSGHLSIANYLENKYNKEVVFCISSTNCDKGKIKKKEIKRRVKQFQDLDRLYFVCNTGTFLNISHNCYIINTNYSNTFSFSSYVSITSKKYPLVMGADTWNRFIDPKYYFNSKEERDRVVSITLKRQNIHVFPRPGIILETMEDTEYNVIIEDDLKLNVSSTEIRNAG